MNKTLSLCLFVFLTACSGSSGGGHGNRLTPAEQLFGKGMGTGQTPTHIVPREDGAGFEILSFGAWGNVYDLTQTNDTIYSATTGGWRGVGDMTNPNHIALYDFLGQRKLDVRENYKFAANASVANSTFVGPAVMYNWHYYTNGWGEVPDNSDYGTMKLQFGENIDNARLEFVMSNPDNNMTVEVRGTGSTGDSFNQFTADRNSVAVSYSTYDSLYNGAPGKTYVGYGSKRQ